MRRVTKLTRNHNGKNKALNVLFSASPAESTGASQFTLCTVSPNVATFEPLNVLVGKVYVPGCVYQWLSGNLGNHSDLVLLYYMIILTPLAGRSPGIQASGANRSLQGDLLIPLITYQLTGLDRLLVGLSIRDAFSLFLIGVNSSILGLSPQSMARNIERVFEYSLNQKRSNHMYLSNHLFKR